MEAVQLATGDRIRDLWMVKRKLGEGGCGVVYEVMSLKNRNQRAALKVEPVGQSKDDEILKMEVHVLRQLQSSQHACRLLLYGKNGNYNFLVMTLLGRALGDLRRQMPDHRMTTSTSVRLGLQCLQAIRDLHKAGFVHRDIKPSNFALGHAAADSRTVYMLDFGLARQFGTWRPDGKFDLREPRSDVAFRGTVRYCSINVHRRMEQGRHDDLWSLFYMLVELVVGGLPWRNAGRKETEQLKATISKRRLLLDCPREFLKIQQHLITLDYTKQPHYDHVRDQLQTVMKRKGYQANDPLDWEPNGRYSHAFRDTFTTETEEITADERRERDQTEGSDSLSDISDSESGAPPSNNEDSYAYDSEKQDTLNNLSGVQ